MFDWLLAIVEWLARLWDAFVVWFTATTAVIIDLLNPVRWFLEGLSWLASFLPPGYEWGPMLSDALIVVRGVAAYYRYADYFVSMGVFFVVVAAMLSVELVLLILRGWRVVRSLVT